LTVKRIEEKRKKRRKKKEEKNRERNLHWEGKTYLLPRVRRG
jgi:hypothetical protein